MRKIIFRAATLIVTLSVAIGMIYGAYSITRGSLKNRLLDYLYVNLPEEARKNLYQEIASRVATMFDVSPEPLVARVGKRNHVTYFKKAQVKLNNAGMRSSKPFTPKRKDTFRIICLGDSMVFGAGGKETDRFCDQMEQFYTSQNVKTEGKRIETYAVGLPSWTAVQEATYMSSRISEYDPDVIVTLTTSNDISDTAGVTGAGTVTHAFSPEHRDWGSAVFIWPVGLFFGYVGPAALQTDLAPEARARWSKAMAAFARLTRLQHRRNNKILFVVMHHFVDDFVELYKSKFHQAQIDAPFMVTSFFSSKETTLGHDSHPNHLGHSILSSHFIHALNKLEWVRVQDQILPELHKDLSLEFNPAPDAAKLLDLKRKFVDENLKTSLDFGSLTLADVRSFLGGVLPWKAGKGALREYPWGTVRTCFLLKRPVDREAKKVEVEIIIPPRIELFPFHIEMNLNGKAVNQYDFPEPNASGRYALVADLPPLSDDDLAIEVLLRTDSYFTRINDATMRSFRLVSARVL